MTDSDNITLPITQLRDYYDALQALKEQEQTALAEAHAEDPRLLAYRFRRGIEAFEGESLIKEPFYPKGRKKLPSPPTPVDEISTTNHFVSQLCDRSAHAVNDADALAFRYVDREISPLRTTTQRKIPRRSLDLLLENCNDKTPIFAEFKMRDDKLSYFALVQILMLAVEFLWPAQRERLKAHRPANDLVWSEEGPFADAYIIVFEPPRTGNWRERSFNATEQISKRLVKDVDFSSHIRRIAYIEASAKNGSLNFEKRFAFGPGV